MQVHYTFGVQGKWSNVWHNSGADILTVRDNFLGFVVPALLPLLDNTCLLARLLVSDDASTEFVTVPVDEAGTSGASGDLLPLFNAVKVLFADGSLGRPDYKFFKGLLTEGGQEEGFINSATEAVIAGLVSDLIDAAASNDIPFVSLDNDEYTSATVQTFVQMRQMHRKRKKVVTPP